MCRLLIAWGDDDGRRFEIYRSDGSFYLKDSRVEKVKEIPEEEAVHHLKRSRLQDIAENMEVQ